MIETDFYPLLQGLQKYLSTKLKVSRGVVKKRVRDTVGVGRRKEPDRIVEYDCHDIKVTVSNTAPTEPQWPAVVFTGIALVFNAKSNHEDILKRWNENHLPKVDLKNAPQAPDDIRITRRNYFPHTNQTYFPSITYDEGSHGYFLFPGQSITYEMNVLFAECLDFSDIELDEQLINRLLLVIDNFSQECLGLELCELTIETYRVFICRIDELILMVVTEGSDRTYLELRSQVLSLMKRFGSVLLTGEFRGSQSNISHDWDPVEWLRERVKEEIRCCFSTD